MPALRMLCLLLCFIRQAHLLVDKRRAVCAGCTRLVFMPCPPAFPANRLSCLVAAVADRQKAQELHERAVVELAQTRQQLEQLASTRSQGALEASK